MTIASMAPVFSTCFGVVYMACFYYDWALFRYYPEAGVFSRAEQAGLGPPIIWYGWVANAAVISALAALAVPKAWAGRIAPRVCYTVNLATLIGMFIYEKRWFY